MSKKRRKKRPKKTKKKHPQQPEKSKRFAGIIIVFLAIAVGFAAGTAALVYLKKEKQRPVRIVKEITPPSVTPVFTDVTLQAGISFRHEAGSTGHFYYPEVMGSGCAFFDADGDGLLDIYFVNGNRLPPESPSPEITNVLYRNNGDGTFSDITTKSGTGDQAYGQGCCAADYDGDGDEDLFVTNYGPNVLYRNKGGGIFEKVTGALNDPGWGQSCAFFDADLDGDLDLYVQNYIKYSLKDVQDWYVVINNKRVKDYCGPQGYIGEQDRLYRNRGDGTFEDITEESGIVQPGGTGMGLVCADLDNDGDMDIMVTNDSRPNFCFVNDGKGHFTDDALGLGIAYNKEGGTEAFMGVDAGDYDGDGLLDLAIPCLRTEGFSLFRNLGDGFRDVSISTGLDGATSSVTGFAPVFFDYDLDGDLDLFFSTGEVGMGRTTPIAGSSFAERYAMKDLLLENRNGHYINISKYASPVFERKEISRACAAGDYDNDGDIDLVVTSMNGKARLLRNESHCGTWIGFALKGRSPNRDAIGARLWLTAGGCVRMREITAGGSYLGQRDRRIVFGLKDCTTIKNLRIRWPDGKETICKDLSVNQYHEIEEK